MRLPGPFRPALSALVLASVGMIQVVPVRADAMRAWNGAAASTTVFGQDSSQQGATAAAGGSGSNNVVYYSRSLPGQFHTVVTGSASASATGLPDQLLSVQSHFYSPNPGTLGYHDGVGGASASASWTKDAVIVTPPVGGTMPDSVRLQFALTFSPPNGDYDNVGSGRSISLTANNQSYSVTASPAPWNSYGTVLSTSGFDSVTAAAGGNPSIGAFHLDLPLSASGVSDPFGLKLDTGVGGVMESNASVWLDESATLALTDVTLPDGTSLKSLGYSVAFESGMPGFPSPVPEPAALACWGLAVLAAGWVWRRRAPH
jgi:MYXO-CTERM domain-containing protein